ncbi:hypothetical protein D3OALGA1CA_880 [Olavius algarvensis associated proteobacterium Delta 3]|nr:hypothetical protein D3OALGA1CA_880 [Olavius algarvensis associated proteobacterium Delta 3]CAB5143608.1 hypothetical protein D3OALGB2SA_4383 [Olavius algarvensis associated proteobacterium Delta 3]
MNHFQHIKGNVAGVLACVLLLPCLAWSSDIGVFAEAAYSDSEIAVYIYTDTKSSELVSFGVNLGYDPGDLEVVAATKNESIWHFRGSTQDYPSLEPDITVPGEAVLIGGYHDTNMPASGVTGSRKLIGIVTFNRLTGNIPVFSLGLARSGDFDNFVDVTGNVIEQTAGAVVFDVTVKERGDANQDGYITNTDFFVIRSLMVQGEFSCFGDCNGDDVITNADFFCVRNKM